MKILDLQQIGEELAVKWDDGGESFIKLETLRRCCPCAGCKGEVDIMGNLYKNPEKPFTTGAFKLTRIERVGGYAIQPTWLRIFARLRNRKTGAAIALRIPTRRGTAIATNELARRARSAGAAAGSQPV